ncbi:MAG TPA: hypothetical protein VHQ47_17915 [Phycisphaerae bacterium]|jgi:hypothetical protein|nr:hypothetical protein [Phycisphaerae bacterium]
MLRIRIKGEAKARIIPGGHDTRPSPDGATLQVIDASGNPIKDVTFKAADVVVVVRCDDPAAPPAPPKVAAAAAPAPAKV